MSDQTPEPLDAEQSEREAWVHGEVLARAFHDDPELLCADMGDHERDRWLRVGRVSLGAPRSPRPATEALDLESLPVRERDERVAEVLRFMQERGYAITHPGAAARPATEAVCTCGAIEHGAAQHLVPCPLAARPATVSEEAVEAALRSHMWDASDDSLCSCGWSPSEYWEREEALVNAENFDDPNPWEPIIVAFVEHQAAALPHLTTQPTEVEAVDVVCAWCPKPARGMAVHGDGLGVRYPSCGEHGTEYEPSATTQPADVDRMVREAEERLVERIEEATCTCTEGWLEASGGSHHPDCPARRARSVRDEGGEQDV